MNKKIICCGDINGDLIIPYGEMINTLEKYNNGECAKHPHVVLQPGGSIANTSLALAKLGESPYLIGKIGQDNCGKELLNKLRQNGVITSQILTNAGDTFVVLVVLNEVGERIMFPWFPSGKRTCDMLKGESDAFNIEDCEWFHTGGLAMPDEGVHERELLRFMSRCKKRGMTISFDLNLRPETYGLSKGRKELISTALNMSDYILGSGMDELGTITGASTLQNAAEQLAYDTGATVIARDGDKPVIVCNSNKITKVDTFNVHQLHKVGAGDSFDAGFIAAIRTGKRIETAVRWGNMCASYTISHLEPMTVPSINELAQL